MLTTVRTSARLLLACALVMGACASSWAGIVRNGGFELGPALVPATSIGFVPVASDSLVEWRVQGGGVNVVGTTYWAAYEGVRSLLLSGASGPGGLEQTLVTEPGATYRLEFGLSGDPFAAPVVKHLRVGLGAVTQDVSFDSSPAWHWNMAWADHAFTFTADAATTTLRFTALDPEPWGGPALDSVRVTLVEAPPPPPPTLALGRLAPDPVVGDATFTFSLHRAGHVRLAVFDLRGRRVATLIEGDRDAGEQPTTHLSAISLGVEPGVFHLVLDAPEGRRVRRFVLLR
jgi:choice-of-anchor C domain-containing protein